MSRQGVRNKENWGKLWSEGIPFWQWKPLWNVLMWGLQGSPQVALREVGLGRDCSRKEIRTSTRVTVVGMEKIKMDVTEGKTIQMEFPSSVTHFALFTLIQSVLLLLWMGLLGIHHSCAPARGQVRSPLLPLPSGPSCSLSGWLSKAGGPQVFPSARRTRQPVPRPIPTPHTHSTSSVTNPAWKTEGGESLLKGQKTKHGEAIHVGERRFW